MNEPDFIFYKNSNRIFLNTSLGCNSNCSYCYLPKLGFNKGKNPSKIKTIKVKRLISRLKNKKILEKGKNGTIISIGCYSECWDEINKEKTKKILKYFLRFENPIQIATKRCIYPKELKPIVNIIQWKGRLTVFVSSATVNEWEKFEQNTIPPERRFETFKIKNKLNIPSVLYIKPVIPGVTINDINDFKKIINKYNLNNVIVGDMFTDKKTKIKAPISNGILYSSQEKKENNYIIKELSKITRVYKSSTEIINRYRRQD